MNDPTPVRSIHQIENRSWLAMLLRGLRSGQRRLARSLRDARGYLRAMGDPCIELGQGCSFGRNINMSATDGGKIIIGHRTSIGDDVQLIARGGLLTIGDDVFIGSGSIIVACLHVSIGSDCLLAEYVVIRDQDHRTDSHPMRNAGLKMSAVRVGRDVWIGTKASILRGSTVGDRCIVGAHALVKSEIASGSVAVGVPAKPRPRRTASC